MRAPANWSYAKAGEPLNMPPLPEDWRRRRPRLDAPRGYCPGCGRRPKVPPTSAGRRWWCATCLQANVAAAAHAAGIPPDHPPTRTTVTATTQGGTP